MNKLEFYTFMKKIPKAEIHLHSEAAISSKTIEKLYKNKSTLHNVEQQKIDNFFNFNNLTEFVQCFIELQKLLETPEDLKYLFDDLSEYLQANNIIYSEVFFSPSSFIKKGFDFDHMLSILGKKIDQIQKETGIIIKIIIDVSRTFGVENAMNNLTLVEKANDMHIIGIGLGGDEQKGPAKEYAAVFKKAKAEGFHVVAHAGEDVGPQSIINSIKYLGIERVGHGITAIEDKDLIKDLAKTQLPLEICVTSNLFTKKVVQNIEDHPVRFFYDNGLFITVNSDDPSFFKSSLTDEFWLFHSKLGFTMSDIKQLVLNGFRAAFITEVEKEKYIGMVEESWNAAIAEMQK